MKKGNLLNFECKREGITDRRMDRQTDGLTDGQAMKTLDAQGGPNKATFGPKIIIFSPIQLIVELFQAISVLKFLGKFH